MTYMGKNFGPDRHLNACKYLVGVMDREKGVMVLHDAVSMTMHPKPNVATGESNEEDGNVGESYRKRYTRMIESFGSGKRKKFIETQQDSQVEYSSLESSVTAAKEYAYTEDDRPFEDDSQTLNELSLIPPFNKDATDPMKVFKLEDLITPEEYFVMKSEAEIFEKAKQKAIDQWKAEKKYPKYVLGQIELLWTMTVSKAVKRKARCLMYLSYLIAIYRTPYRDFNEKGLEQFSLPSEVESRIRKVFTEHYAAPGRKPCYVMTPRLKDKLLMYILVLALYIENFSFDCGLLARDLGLQPQKMAEYWRAVGCKMKIVQPKKENGPDQALQLIVELKVPFTLPTPGKKRFSQRKR
jgi:hypothetical protein